MYTGNQAGSQYTGTPSAPSSTTRRATIALQPAARRHRHRDAAWPLRGSGDGTNDVLQYWFGGYLQIPGDGLDEDGRRRTTWPGSTTRSPGPSGR